VVDNNLKRYELFGWDYKFLNPLTDNEVVWYVKYAQRVGDPVLELACGTGRRITAYDSRGTPPWNPPSKGVSPLLNTPKRCGELFSGRCCLHLKEGRVITTIKGESKRG